MKYLTLTFFVLLCLSISAQKSNFGAVTVFNSVSCGDSSLHIIPVSNVGDQVLSNCYIRREVLDTATMLIVFKDSSEVVDIQGNGLYSFQMYLYGENIDKDGDYAVQFTIIADSDENQENTTPQFSITVKRCCKISLQGLEQISCNGDTDGAIEVAGTNGTPPYSYFWSNGVNGTGITDLGAGEYSIMVFDASFCIASDTFILVDPDPILANIVVQHESKPDKNDGTAEAMPNGGRPPYTYLWSTGATTPDIVDLPPGDYSLTITDSKECQKIFNTTIDSFMCDLDASIQGQIILCPGETDLYDAMVINGNPPYSYLWNTGSSSPQIQVSAGMYDLTVTDSDNCKVTAFIDIDLFPPIIVDTVEIIDATGSLENGSILVDVFGGTPPYGYAWFRDSMVVSNDEDLIDFPAGDYNLRVIDSESCVVATDTITINSISSTYEFQEAIEIFPNPASNVLIIESKQLFEGEIFDLYGNRILKIPESKRYFWPVKSQSSGIYYLRTFTNGNQVLRKIVVSH